MNDETITLLGNAGAKWPASPDDATLETFPNRNPEQEY